MAGDQDHFGVGQVVFGFFQQCDAVQIVHHQIGDDDVERLVLDPLGSFEPGGGHFALVADPLQGFGYGLGDFLELAQRVGASPWIVIPTVFTDDECAGLGAWLAAPGRVEAGREVLVEFGNENWNDIFRPAGIADQAIHGPLANRCLAAVREHSGGVNLKTVTVTKVGDFSGCPPIDGGAGVKVADAG